MKTAVPRSLLVERHGVEAGQGLVEKGEALDSVYAAVSLALILGIWGTNLDRKIKGN